jgi:probable HAF family extracellular repeat protein
MKKILRLCVFQISAAILFIIPAGAWPKVCTPTYTVTALAIPAGFSQEIPTGINDRGDVIGTALGDAYDNGVLIHRKKITNIAPVPANSYANAINERGDIAGALSNGNKFLGFIYRHGKLTSFEPFANALETDATSLNDIGQVAGYFSPAGLSINSNDHIFIRQPDGTFSDLGAFGVDPGVATINNQGRLLIGALDADGAHTHAYLSRPGSTSLEKIPPLILGGSVNAVGMNQIGVVIGSASVDATNNKFHAFVYFEGRIKDLGVLPGGDSTWAGGINNLGQTTGQAVRVVKDADGSIIEYVPSAWVDLDGTMRDVNTMLSPNSKNWAIYVAYSINDRAEVVGMGSFNGGPGGPVLLSLSR